MKYRELGRGLNLGDTDLEVIENDHYRHGTHEVAYQVLLKWINRNGTKAKKSILIGALRGAELGKLCDKIP